MEFLLFLQNIRTPALEMAALIVSLLCDKLILISVFCILYWCVNKEKAYGLALSYVVSGILVQGIKVFARVPRPFVRSDKIHPVNAAIDTATGYSFPSGHTQTAAALLGYGAFSTKKVFLKLLAFLGIFAVMLSRMTLGVHTPADVMVSFLITIAVVLIVKAGESINLKKHIKAISISGSVISLLLFAVTVWMVIKKTTTYELSHDCITACICSFVFFFCWYIENTYIKFDSKATFSGKGDFISQGIKFVFGILGVVIIYVTLSLFENVFVDGLKYALVFTWICGIYPLIIRKKCKRI